MAQTQCGGCLVSKGRSWHVRWSEYVPQSDGSLKRINRSKKLASRRGFPRKSDVCNLFQEFMDQHRSTASEGRSEAGFPMTVGDFIERTYLPYVKDQKRPSTYRGYGHLWRNHVKRVLDANLRLGQFLPKHGHALMQTVGKQEGGISKTTLQHVKAFLSGAFTHAQRLGAYSGSGNPMRAAQIPAGRPPRKTYAYSLSEIRAILGVLGDENILTIVQIAAFTGIREGEIRGLRWEDYDPGRNWEHSGTAPGLLSVNRSIWRQYEGLPKNGETGVVPVISLLVAQLNRYHALVGSPCSGWMFPGAHGNPLDLDALGQRLKAKLAERDIAWHGWHAFRRGLATNLHDLGVDDKTIQAILRHSDVSVTQRLYIKSLPRQSAAALTKLERAYETDKQGRPDAAVPHGSPVN